MRGVRGVRDIRGVEAHQPRDSVPVVVLRSGAKLGADPGDGGPHRALVGGLALDAEEALPAVAGFKPVDHRTHEGEVPSVQLALARGVGRWLAGRLHRHRALTRRWAVHAG